MSDAPIHLLQISSSLESEPAGAGQYLEELSKFVEQRTPGTTSL